TLAGHTFVDDLARFTRVQLKEVGQRFADDLRYRTLHFRIEQLNFGLALELRIGVLDADDGRQTFERITAAEVGVFFLDEAILARIAVDHTGHGGAETGEMRTAIRRVD